jgi:pilus assembly protein CpaE
MSNRSGTPEYMIRVLIVDDNTETQTSLKRALTFETAFEVVGVASTGQEGINLAKSLSPDIVLMDINMPDMDGLAATATISKESPDSQIIIMSIQNETNYMQRAMAAGARSFLSKPPAIDELYATIHNVYDRRRAKTYQPEVEEASSSPEAQIIMVYSPQAGAGATTIATNLAAALMRDDAKVLLMDCNLYFGDVGVFLNVPVRKTIADLSGIVDDVELETVDNVLATHDSGLKILLAPPTPQAAGVITVDQVVNLITYVCTQFDYIVIDTATDLGELNLALFDLAGLILLICTPTLPAVKNVHHILDLLDTLHIDANKVQVVLNRVNSEFEKTKITLSVQAIEQNLKRRMIASIPLEERRLLSAVNRGIAVVAKDRAQSPAKELMMLMEVVRETLIQTTPNMS